MLGGVKEKVINSKSRTFLLFCFCFIFGVGVFSGFEFASYWLYRLYLLLFLLGFLLILFWHKINWRFLLWCGLFFVLGGARFMFSVPVDNDPNLIKFYNGEQKDLTGYVADEPEIGIAGVKYVVEMSSRGVKRRGDPQEVAVLPTVARNDMVTGKILVNLPLYPEYQYGDELKIKCNLQSPKNFVGSNFRYDNYLARQEIWSVCISPVILSVNEGSSPQSLGVILKSKMLKFKSYIGEKINVLWPEPESSLMAGLLYGARSSMPDEIKNNFNRVGLTHIVAISGYNISIIAAILMASLISLGLNRRRAFWFCVSGIILFVLFTGATASVVRAGIMGIIVLLAQQLGRLSRVGNILVATAALILLINPYVLIWDAGFQLSFLATIGLVYLSPILEDVILNLFQHLFRSRNKFGMTELSKNFLFESLVSTLSAIIATLPLMLYQFGRLSVVAPLANILILWVIPWLMFFGFISVLLSIMFFPLGLVLAWITGLGLKYVIISTQWFASFSWSSIEFSLSLWAMVGLYIIMVFLIIKNNYEKN